MRSNYKVNGKIIWKIVVNFYSILIEHPRLQRMTRSLVDTLAHE